jgi:hypothetical protein
MAIDVTLSSGAAIDNIARRIPVAIINGLKFSFDIPASEFNL